MNAEEKNAIIKEAVSILGGYIYLDDYNVKIEKNSDETFVIFSMPVKFVPINSAYYYGAYVNITEKMSVKHPIANSEKSAKKLAFFTFSPEIIQQVVFVLNSISEGETFKTVDDIKQYSGNITIKEHKAYYEIIALSYIQESLYKVEKESGKIVDEEHNHLVPESE